jgi:hypothetical protein
LLLAGMVFGVLLAGDVIRPIRWKADGSAHRVNQ